MKNLKDLLPIGSVVLLHNGKKRLMITGVLQSKAVSANEEYDYLGVMYPEGNLGEDFQYLFNTEDIREIVFRGYEDEERTLFLDRLAGFYRQ